MELPGLLGGGIKSVQTGWVETTTPTMVAAADAAVARSATGEDQVYVDVTISAVDTAKSVVGVVGAFGYYVNSLSNDTGGYKARIQGVVTGAASGSATHQITARLLNTTTLRLSSDRPIIADSSILSRIFACRWTVVEGK
ncbi:MAG: hypothetical protein E6Q75_02465 [Rheinheimera sp.]|nr:MAG: hypothetical protein E6Q75_02465 [Rheinheimera sp.]